MISSVRSIRDSCASSTKIPVPIQVTLKSFIQPDAPPEHDVAFTR